MKCPKCSSDKLSVIDSRSDGEAIKRRRSCQACEFRFSTFERVEYILPMVVKKDGRREHFDRSKLRDGLEKACEKRPISMEQVETVIEAVVGKLQALCEREIDSRRIGDFLMEELKQIDHIAYVRFASVYREFSDVQEFVSALEGLEEAEKQRSLSNKKRETQAKVANSDLV